jgi:hypothetical protein
MSANTQHQSAALSELAHNLIWVTINLRFLWGLMDDETATANGLAAKKHKPTSTVGRGRTVEEVLTPSASVFHDELITTQLGDSALLCQHWPSPTVIISDGAYGVLGFEGDTSDHFDMPQWYEPNIAAWSKRATALTTLWFWNSEIGWAAVHPMLEKHGWRYVNANIWNKGIGHIAGNVNTAKIRRFPVVSEVCVQYVFEAQVRGTPLREWLYAEWKRTGLPLRKANEACGVKDAAVRKYLDQGHLWYYPPPEMFLRMQEYANEHGRPEGRPYFSIYGDVPGTAEQWMGMRAKFRCPHGVTNVWERRALRGEERFKVSGDSGKAVHLNQKPLDLMKRIIETSSDPGDVVWEPFGGLFSGCVAAGHTGRRAYGAEIDPTYFHYGLQRLSGRDQPHLGL